MNKVLNRPLFRKAALKKGYLKPIHAQNGIMVGQPINNPNPQINPRTQVPALRPNIMRRAIGDLRAFAQRPGQFFSPKVTRFVPGAGTAALIGMEGLAPIIGAGRRKLGLSDESALAPIIDYGLAGLLTATPIGRVAGLTALAGRAALGAKDYVQGKKIGTTMSALSPDLGKPLGLFDRPEPGATGRRKAKRGDVSGITLEEIAKADEQGFKTSPRRRQVEKSLASLRNQGDELAEEKYAGAGEADLNKIQEDTISPNLPGEPRDEAKVASADVKQPEVKQPKTTIEKAATEDINKSTANTIQKGGASDDPVFNQNIKLARQYFDELDKGQSSQAKLVFLSNLASGLLTGTTTRGGVGGALEVFGQALGPAVNNLVTVKLKEGELRAKRRETSLNAALEHMQFINESVNNRPEIDDRGIIQIRGTDGVLRNYRGVVGKDGTAFLYGGLGQDGREVLVPIQQQGGIVDSRGNLLGDFEDFKSQKDLTARLFDLQDILGNRYNALSVTRDVLKTLGQEDMQGEKPKAGAALTVDTFIRRFSGVVKELAGANVMDDISGFTESQLNSKLEQYYQRELQAIERSDLSDKEKEKAKEEIDKDSLLKAAKNRLKKRGLFSGLSRDEQEKLAVQETTLVYALANTFKDQDRLTQRDINAAREIVNIFSLARSSKDVEASIKAIGQQLESDIRRTESLYREAGGLEATILRLRRLAEFETFGRGTVPTTLFKDFTPEEIQQGLEDVQL